MRISGIGLRSMKNVTIEGEVLFTDKPITFLGFVDKETGNIVDEEHPLYGQSIKNTVTRRTQQKCLMRAYDERFY